MVLAAIATAVTARAVLRAAPRAGAAGQLQLTVLLGTTSEYGVQGRPLIGCGRCAIARFESIEVGVSNRREFHTTP
jgi:hypothetical protein